MSKPMARSMPSSAREPSGADHAGDRSGFHHRHRLAPRLPIDMMPPFERMMSILPANCAPRADSLRAGRGSGCTRGPTKALSTVVEVRSYSRNSRRISWLTASRTGRGMCRAQHFAGRGARAPDWHRHAGSRPRPPRCSSATSCRRQRFDARRVDRHEHLARRIHALGDLEGEFARHQRPRPMEEQIERLDPVAAPDGVDVAEARGGDQRGPGALASPARC